MRLISDWFSGQSTIIIVILFFIFAFIMVKQLSFILKKVFTGRTNIKEERLQNVLDDFGSKIIGTNKYKIYSREAVSRARKLASAFGERRGVNRFNTSRLCRGY